MDIMKIETKFGRHLLGAFIRKWIKKKTGIDVGVFINSVSFENDPKQQITTLHLDIDLQALPSKLSEEIEKVFFA